MALHLFGPNRWLWHFEVVSQGLIHAPLAYLNLGKLLVFKARLDVRWAHFLLVAKLRENLRLDLRFIFFAYYQRAYRNLKGS